MRRRSGLRTGPHALAVELAEHASVPVINMLTSEHHPCQALADLLTLREAFGELDGLTLAYVGDGNNVARSLAILGALAGVQVRVAAPDGYQLEPVADAELTDDPREAVSGADAVYTDVWVSMSDDPATAEERRRALRDYRIDDELLSLAAPRAIALHCLPAHPGEEITAEVLYGERQRIWDQAENRRHAQKALLELLLAEASRKSPDAAEARARRVRIGSRQRHDTSGANSMPAAKRSSSSSSRSSSVQAGRQAHDCRRQARREGHRDQHAQGRRPRRHPGQVGRDQDEPLGRLRRAASSRSASPAASASTTAKTAGRAAASTAKTARSGAKGTATAAKRGAKSAGTTAKRGATRTRRAGGGSESIGSVAEQLVRGLVNPRDVLMLTRDRIQETLDEAASRGRVTRKDANDLVAELVRRGRAERDDLVSNFEQLVDRGRGQIEAATKRARRAEPVDRLVRGADRARRTVGVGPSFPILGYDDLNANQVQSRLSESEQAGAAQGADLRAQQRRPQVGGRRAREGHRLSAPPSAGFRSRSPGLLSLKA